MFQSKAAPPIWETAFYFKIVTTLKNIRDRDILIKFPLYVRPLVYRHNVRVPDSDGQIIWGFTIDRQSGYSRIPMLNAHIN